MAAGPTIYRFPKKKLPATKPLDKDKRRWEKMRKKANRNPKIPIGSRD